MTHNNLKFFNDINMMDDFKGGTKLGAFLHDDVSSEAR
jgi:hypothetical protein